MGKDVEDEIQKVVNDYTQKAEDLYHAKEKDIMTI
jgi:ribosome recycling factor